MAVLRVSAAGARLGLAGAEDVLGGRLLCLFFIVFDCFINMSMFFSFIVCSVAFFLPGGGLFGQVAGWPLFAPGASTKYCMQCI